MKRITTLTLFVAVAGMISSCTEQPNTQQGNKRSEGQETITADVPQFNEDSAFAYIEKQVAFGPRVPNSDAHTRCADYLVSTLKQYKASVYVQKGTVTAFDGKKLNIKNIIAAFNPEKTRRVLLCAHWDTRPFSDQDPEHKNIAIDGANDGGSGVGVLLEIARQFSIQSPEIGVDIILFDAEDYGQPENSGFPEMRDSYCLGTQYWAKNPPTPGYKPLYGILLDMVGGENARFTQDEISRSFAPAIVEKVWNIGNKIGYSSYFVYDKSSSIIDDHYYINTLANIPTIDIIHRDESTPYGFWKHWHTTGDKISNIDKRSLKATGQTVMTVVYSEK